YALLPGVDMFRRPADATFILGALLAILAGYLLHRWLEGSLPKAGRVQRAIGLALPMGFAAAALWLADRVVSVPAAAVPLATGAVCVAAAAAFLWLARRYVRAPLLAGAAFAAFMAADFGWNASPIV